MSKLETIKHNKSMDHLLLAVALMKNGNKELAVQHLQAAASMPDANTGMRILEANNRAAYAAQLTANTQEDDVQVVDVGQVDLGADELQNLVIEEDEDEADALTSNEEEEVVEEHEYEDDFSEEEVHAALQALRAAKQVKAAKAAKKPSLAIGAAKRIASAK